MSAFLQGFLTPETLKQLARLAADADGAILTINVEQHQATITPNRYGEQPVEFDLTPFDGTDTHS